MKAAIIAAVFVACLPGTSSAKALTDEDVGRLKKQILELQDDVADLARQVTALQVKAADQGAKITVLQKDGDDRDAKIVVLGQTVTALGVRKLRVRWAPGDWQPMATQIASASCEPGEFFIGLTYELSGTLQNPPFVVTKIAPDGPAGGKMTWDTQAPKGLVRVQAACARLD
jgi:hypothetical protein